MRVQLEEPRVSQENIYNMDDMGMFLSVLGSSDHLLRDRAKLLPDQAERYLQAFPILILGMICVLIHREIRSKSGVSSNMNVVWQDPSSAP